MTRFVSLCCVGALLSVLVVCKKNSNAEPAKATYLTDANSVGFDISARPGKDETRRWDATYSDRGRTAKFIIEIGLPMRMDPDAGLQISSGHGAIVAERGSDASTMLIALAKALEAKHVPAKVQRISALPFDYVFFGEHNSQATGGGFSAEPPGNWTAMKIFVGDGDDEAEVFLNFDPVAGKAQFSIKDPEYGDAIVAKLASVL